MASLYKRGNVWWVLYYVDNKRVRKPVSRNYKEAYKFKKEVETKIIKGDVDKPEEKKTISLEKAKARFFNKLKIYAGKSTYENYKFILGKFFDYLGGEEVHSVTEIEEKTIEGYLLSRKKANNIQGGRLKISTLNWEVKGIKKFIKTCEELGFLEEGLSHKIKTIKEKKRIPFFFTKEHLDLIFSSSETIYIKKLYLFLLLSGLRPGELCDLTYDDIDLPGRKIFLRVKKDWEPKTNERTVPISEELALLIESIPRLQKKYVFVTERGDKFNVHAINTRFLRLRRSIGLERGTPHTFRHTYAALITMKSGNIRALQKILGHQKLETTQIYSHITDEYLKKVTDEVDLGLATILATMKKNGKRKRRLSN